MLDEGNHRNYYVFNCMPKTCRKHAGREQVQTIALAGVLNNVMSVSPSTGLTGNPP